MPDQQEEPERDPIAALIARLRGGDHGASVLRGGDRVLRRAEPVARAVCRAEARGLAPAEVEECVQETLERVWRKLPEFEVDGPPFEAWVRGFALNVIRNARRKRRDVLDQDGVLDPVDPAWSVLRALRREERDALVIAAIPEGLSPLEQEVLCLRYCHDQGRRAIAELLGLSDANEVRVILIRARRHLHNELLRRLDELGHGLSMLRSSGDGAA